MLLALLLACPPASPEAVAPQPGALPPAPMAEAAPPAQAAPPAHAAPPAPTAAAPEVAPSVDPAADLAAAKAALAEKRLDDALTAFERCGAAGIAECRWEAGWIYWVRRDWAQVVTRWEGVRALDPAWPKLDANLTLARDQLTLHKLAAELRAKAPGTFSSSAPAGAQLRLRAVGDMMIGTDFPAGALPPDGGAGTFTGVRELLSNADVTFGNLEGPLCDRPEPSDKCRPDAKPGSCYAFRTPTSYGRWFKEAGFDVVSTANNHAFDFGEPCRAETEAALNAQGIKWSGRPGTYASWETNGLKIAMVGFHTAESANNLNDLELARTLVGGLAASHDLMIVSFHGGAEGSKALHVPVGSEQFYGENRGNLRVFTHAMIDAGADLVLGHGPHVLRGMEGYKGRLIAYSLGNFATYGRFNLSGNQGIGAVLEVSMARDGSFLAGQIHGTVQEGLGIPQPDPTNAAADLVRLLSSEDFPDSGAVVAQDGSLKLR